MADAELLCLIAGPSTEMRRESAGDKWCFGCRKRLPHDRVLRGDPPPDDPNDDGAWAAWENTTGAWYEPIWMLECSGCKSDRTDFPGTL